MSFETFNFDDVVDDETYETLKWMAKRKKFLVTRSLINMETQKPQRHFCNV